MIKINWIENKEEWGYKIKMIPGGISVESRVSPTRFQRDNIINAIHEEIQDGVREQVGESEIYWRFTNNKAEQGIVNEIYSTDHRDGQKEKGLSVAEHLGYSIGHKYGYKVSGEVVGYGADSEPLLNPATVEVIGKMISTKTKKFAAIERKGAEAQTLFLLKKGWTEADYVSLMRGKFL